MSLYLLDTHTNGCILQPWLQNATFFFTSLFLQRSSPSGAYYCFQRTASLFNIISCLIVPKKMKPQHTGAEENTHQLDSWSPLGIQNKLAHSGAPHSYICTQKPTCHHSQVGGKDGDTLVAGQGAPVGLRPRDQAFSLHKQPPKRIGWPSVPL